MHKAPALCNITLDKPGDVEICRQMERSLFLQTINAPSFCENTCECHDAIPIRLEGQKFTN